MNPPFPSSLEAVLEASKALHQPGTTLEDVTQPVEALLLNAIENQPRSLQKRIGPSEIGTECDHCLAAKLAGWEENSSGIPWASTVGTAIPALLESFVNNHQAQAWNPRTDPTPPPTRYFTEQTVTVGTIGGQPITGSIDLLDVATGTTVDWKAVNPTRLRDYKTRGPSQVYRVQAHLYAKGCNDAGIPVNRVSICFLPRGSNNFFERHWWSEPYDRSPRCGSKRQMDHQPTQGGRLLLLQTLPRLSTPNPNPWRNRNRPANNQQEMKEKNNVLHQPARRTHHHQR